MATMPDDEQSMWVFCNWHDRWENALSRRIKSPDWAPIPGWRNLGVQSVSDLGILAALAQVAIKAPIRGRLCYRKGSAVLAHTSETLAAVMPGMVTPGQMHATLLRCVSEGIIAREGEMPKPPPDPKPKKKEAKPKQPQSGRAHEKLDEADVAPLMSFPIKGTAERYWRLTPARLAKLEEGFPGLDVMDCCRRARLWCESHPHRRKTKNGMMRFLSNWCGRDYDDRQSRQSAGPRELDGRPLFETGDPIRLASEKEAAEIMEGVKRKLCAAEKEPSDGTDQGQEKPVRSDDGGV